MSEYENWMHQQYPYDLASCGLCITMHTSPAREQLSRGKCEHDEMVLTLTEQLGKDVSGRQKVVFDQWLVENRERIIALRELFASHYSTNPSEVEGHSCPSNTSASTVSSSVS